jgi:hypothetical protein
MMAPFSCIGLFIAGGDGRKPGDVRWPSRRVSLGIALYLTIAWSLIATVIAVVL